MAQTVSNFEEEAHRLRVYTADIAPLLERSALFDTGYQRVSAPRRQKIDRMQFQKDKCLSLGAELLLMGACRDFGIDYEKAELIRGEYGKPAFRNFPVCFNLSHSEHRVMCAMSDLPVGCDVEKMRPAEQKIAERFLAPDEFRALEACRTPEEREIMFFRLWTCKESFMKCTGLGFRLPLDSFSVLFHESSVSVRQSVDCFRYVIREWDRNDGYRYAWCLQAGPENSFLQASNPEWVNLVDTFL